MTPKDFKRTPINVAAADLIERFEMDIRLNGNSISAGRSLTKPHRAIRTKALKMLIKAGLVEDAGLCGPSGTRTPRPANTASFRCRLVGPAGTRTSCSSCRMGSGCEAHQTFFAEVGDNVNPVGDKQTHQRGATPTTTELAMTKSTTTFAVGTVVTNSVDIRSYNANPKKRTLLAVAGTRKGVVVEAPCASFGPTVWVKWEDDAEVRSSHPDAVRAA